MGTPLRVLIVEDSEDDAALLLRHLRQGGYDSVMRRVETPDDMREALNDHTWDLVISDYNMPHFSGPAALETLHESGLNLPFIIVSGVIGEDAAVAAMRAGAHDYVMKGNMARLAPAIERELREQAALEEEVAERKRAEEGERIRAQELESLVSIATILVQPDSFDEKCNRVLQELAHIAQAERVTLALADEERRELRVVAAVGDSILRMSSTPIRPYGQGLAGRVSQQRHPLVVNDYATSEYASAEAVASGVRSALALPIHAGERLLGTITIGSPEPNHFTAELVRLITTVGNGIGALLENARLYQQISAQLEQGRRRLEVFQAAARGLALARLPDEALQHLVDMARTLIEARYGALVLWDQKGRIETWVVSGLSPEEQEAAGSSPMGLGLLSLVREKGKSVRLNDTSAHPKASGLLPGHPPMRNFLGIPIVFPGKAPGAFYLTDREDGAEFTEDDERLLNVFAVLAGTHLENASLYEQVSRERSTLAAVQGSMTEGLVVIDQEGLIAYFNEAAGNLLKFAGDGILGKSVLQAMGITAPNAETQKTFESLLEMQRPEPCQISIAVFPIADCVECSEETMVGMVVRDVTQERELEHRRDTFVSVASHELRTPMTTILGFTELLLERDPPQATRREWLERIRRGSQRLATIVDELLNVSRLQSGKLTANLETLSLPDLVERVVEETRPTTESHGFLVDIPQDLPPVTADPQKLIQVLANLLDNAIKYSPRGGLITTSAYYDDERHQVVTSISDQGIGIAPDDQQELFTTFHRIRQPETESVGGTGLGLYIVRGLVELMEGEVWLESTPGKGSTFFFSTPSAAGAVPENRQAGVGELPVT